MIPTNGDGTLTVSGYWGQNTTVTLANKNPGAGVVLEIDVPNNKRIHKTLSPNVPKFPNRSYSFALSTPGHLVNQLPQYNGFKVSALSDAYVVMVTVTSDMCEKDETIWQHGVTGNTEPAQGTATANVMVKMGRRVLQKTTMRYGTADGTAKNGSDYRAVGGMLTFNKGEQIKYIQVPILADAVADPGESFTVYLNALPAPDNQTTVHVVNPTVAIPVTITDTPPAAGTPTPGTPATPQKPGTPQGLRVTAVGPASIGLAWNAVAGATSYQIVEGGTTVTTATTTSATITGLAAGSAHTYAVRAVNAAGTSASSASVTATTQKWSYGFRSQTTVDSTGAAADLAHARPGQTLTVTMTVVNTGNTTWSNSGANAVLLATDDPRDHAGTLRAPGWVSPNRPARLAEASVAPGASGRFSFPVTAPDAATPKTMKESYRLTAEGITWLDGPGLSVTVTTVPITGLAVVAGTDRQQWLVAADGGVFAHAGAPFHGSMGGKALSAPVVGIASTPSGRGYWLVGADGGVFAYGDAPFHGSMGGKALNRPVVGMTATPSGRGYWLVAADGGVFAYGDAPFLGSMGGKDLNRPVVGIASTPSGRGYWLAAADGGVFAYGDAVFAGNLVGRSLNAPIVGISAAPGGRGYWMAGADGGVFAFGAAPFVGSLGAGGAARPVVGIAGTAGGYALVDRAGQTTFFTAGAPVTRSTLHAGERLQPGERLTSGNGRYALVMQDDGNLVEYDGGTAVWASGTFAAGSTFEAQSDGNFVVYAPGHVARWATGTNRAGSVLVIQDDRNVVVYGPGNQPVWGNGRSL
jgi:hypothetical protein